MTGEGGAGRPPGGAGGTPQNPGPGPVLRLHTDGASRGNPGPAAIGVVVARAADGSVVEEIGEYLGATTNNVAEYRALIAGLRRAAELGAAGVEVVSDSELLVRQVQGRYKVRHPGLLPLFEEVRRLSRGFPGGVRIQHTLRGGNRRADELANRAIDAAQGRGGDRRRAGGERAGPAGPPRPAAGRAAAAPDESASPPREPAPAARPDADLFADAFALARDLRPGETADLGGGMRVARLAPEQAGAGTWALVLRGRVEVGGRTLEPGQCCRAPARYRAVGAEDAVLLERGSGM